MFLYGDKLVDEYSLNNICSCSSAFLLIIMKRHFIFACNLHAIATDIQNRKHRRIFTGDVTLPPG